MRCLLLPPLRLVLEGGSRAGDQSDVKAESLESDPLAPLHSFNRLLEPPPCGQGAGDTGDMADEVLVLVECIV